MNVSVKLFAVARQRAGRGNIIVELPAGATVQQLRAALAAQCPPLVDLLKHSRVAVNSDYAGDAAAIPESAEIALIPPVSGG